MEKENIETILIAEDDSTLRRLYEIFIRNEYDVILAENGEKALDEFKDKSRIKLVLSDYNMGSGMNGLDLINKIKDSNPNIGTILCSGNLRLDTAKMNNVNRYIQKPCSIPDDIMPAIREVLDEYKE